MSEENFPVRDLLNGLSNGLSGAVEKVSASVVAVVGGRRFPGSGVVYGAGLVLTSLPVVGDGDSLGVVDDSGEAREAELVGYDHRSGLALLRVEDLDAPAASPVGGTAKVGALALTIGRPVGGTGGVRARFGIVASLESGREGRGYGRRWRTRRGAALGSGADHTRLRLDSAPYPGLGGGAAVSASGELLGVVVSGSRDSTFAVPAASAWEVSSRLESGASMRRGYLGVYSQPVNLPESAGLDQEGGLLVAGVLDDTPASEAGILVGDIIATLDGHPVLESEDLAALLQGERVGTPIPVKLLRGGVPTEVTVTIAERGPRRPRGRRR